MMKHFLCIASALFFSTTVFASNELEVNGSPLTLLLNDNNIARVSSCSDFISLRKAGETVKDILYLSEPDYISAKSELTDCYIIAYTIQHNSVKNKTTPPLLNEILKHFPASEKLIISNDDKKDVQKNYNGESIWDTSPDLMDKNGILQSESDGAGYRLISHESYSNKYGKVFNIVTIAAFTLQGTYGIRKIYIINPKDKKIWDIVKIDENSPLQ